MSLRFTAIMLVAALAACSNGRGTLSEAPPAAPGQAEPPASPAPTPAPTPTPTPAPTPTPTPAPAPAPPEPTPPPAPQTALAGYWLGTLTAESGRVYAARAFVTGAGDMHFAVASATALTASSVFVVYGNVCCESDVDVDLQSKGYLAESEREARFRASVAGNALSGELKIRGEDYEFSLDRSTRYAETLTLQDLAGTYTRTTTALLGPSSTYTVTLDANGALTGSHTNGCIYNGTVSLPDPPFNIVKFDVALSNCPSSITGSGSMSGTYSGLGLFARDTPPPNDPTQQTGALMHSLVGVTWLGLQSPAR